MSATERGRQAESLAANYLRQRGFQIVAQNWHNRFAEIDLIAEAKGVIHIVEVKYRHQMEWGSGFDYINRDKLQRLHQAAQHWRSEADYSGPIQIDAIAVTGELSRPVIEFLPNITA